MLKNKELRLKVIQLYYNVLVAGHRDRWKITELVTRNYWWPEYVEIYIKECDLYQSVIILSLDPKLGSGCNLGKNLSKSKGDN